MASSSGQHQRVHTYPAAVQFGAQDNYTPLQMTPTGVDNCQTARSVYGVLGSKPPENAVGEPIEVIVGGESLVRVYGAVVAGNYCVPHATQVGHAGQAAQSADIGTANAFGKYTESGGTAGATGFVKAQLNCG